MTSVSACRSRRTFFRLALTFGLAFSGRADAQLACEEWRQLAPFPQPAPRFNAAMVYDSDRQKVILFGGEARVPGPAAIPVFFDDTWEFDFATGWRQVAGNSSTPRSRAEAAMAYDPVRKRVVLYGGRDSDSVEGTIPETDEYDPATASWALGSESSSNPGSTAGGGPWRTTC